MAVKVPSPEATRGATWVSYTVERFAGGTEVSHRLPLNGSPP
ncbi:hypothetical protein [Streptomyces litchfieldiae]|uniref:Uncharacterized protein n=1 Tax=Streptomyces litchfieldiae TaxID=3075543 RepID=A0ABU2MS02_9ACTN|nr:hypothetical protein [Streptomyces sp. DSM 44938]MDT0344402.1 hypothetical protein [Streptomyces sp. DSM 44938]